MKDKYLDVSLYINKYTTLVNMSLWSVGQGSALASNSKNHINYERFLGEKLAREMAVRSVNKQSRKVAGIDIVK